MKLASLKKLFPLLLLLSFYTYLLAKPIDLTVIDLGRHLTNGREIIQGNLEVLFENTYAHTMKNQPFVNHHWLAGVVFYLIYSASGFIGLHLAHTLILLITFSLFFLLLKKHSSQLIAFVLSTLAIMFFASRAEIRPESFGLMILMIYLHFINRVQSQLQISWQTIALLFGLQILWTNLHISFIFGPFVFGLFWLITNRSKQKYSSALRKKLLIIWLGTSLVTLLNPNGLEGSLVPLTILGDYGYRVFENQTLWFLRDYYRGPIIPLFYLTSLVVGFNLLFLKFKTKLFDRWLAITGITLGFLALRNISLFTIFTFPLLATQFQQIVSQWKKHPPIKIESPRLFSLVLMIGTFSVATFITRVNPVFGKYPIDNSSFGLINGQQEMLSFLTKLPAGVRIFNNYDIGSVLVFTLYPETTVFVDNRPEAFSAEFFQQLYIPLQQNESDWQIALDVFDFQYLIIGHRDLTSWTQTFIKNRLKDPEWEITYQDAFLIVFARNIDRK